MSVTKEFIVLMEDRPSTLGKLCQALADRGVNILALQSFPIGGKTRFIVDNPTTAKTVLNAERLSRPQPPLRSLRLRRTSKLSHGSGRYLLPVIFGTGPQQWRSSLSLR